MLHIKMRAVDEVGGKRKSQASCVSSGVASSVGVWTLCLSVGGSRATVTDIQGERVRATARVRGYGPIKYGEQS